MPYFVDAVFAAVAAAVQIRLVAAAVAVLAAVVGLEERSHPAVVAGLVLAALHFGCYQASSYR